MYFFPENIQFHIHEISSLYIEINLCSENYFSNVVKYSYITLNLFTSYWSECYY